MKKKLFVIAALVVLIVTALCAMPVVSANSAQRYWFGTTGQGAVIVGEQIPLTVKSERIVFDVQQFPFTYYGSGDEEEFKNYNASVTAVYEFENPADYDVTARLAFPYGTMPSYLNGDYDTSSRYGVTVNGEDADVVKRYTYVGAGNWIDSYENGTAVGRLLDEKKSAGGIDKNSKVVKYTYKTGGTEYNGFTAHVEAAKEKGQYLFCDATSISEDLEKISYGQSLYNGANFVFWSVFGGEEPQFELYATKGGREGKKIQCDFTLAKKEEMTLEEYAESVYALDDDSESAHVDWFNLISDSIVNGYSEYQHRTPFYNIDLFVTEKIMHWMEYTLEVPAKGVATNSVTAPLFPDIDNGWEPSVYTYGYLLSPAADWADFGTLDIEINTPFKMVGTAKNLFEKTDTGYKAHFDSLPDGELTFELCESENPVKDNSGYLEVLLLYLCIFGVPVLGFTELVLMITFACIGANRKNKTASKTERAENTLCAAGQGFIGCVAASSTLILGVVSILAGVGGIAGEITVIILSVLFSAAVTVATVLLCRNNKYKSHGKNGSDFAEVVSEDTDEKEKTENVE